MNPILNPEQLTDTLSAIVGTVAQTNGLPAPTIRVAPLWRNHELHLELSSGGMEVTLVGRYGVLRRPDGKVKARMVPYVLIDVALGAKPLTVVQAEALSALLKIAAGVKATMVDVLKLWADGAGLDSWDCWTATQVERLITAKRGWYLGHRLKVVVTPQRLQITITIPATRETPIRNEQTALTWGHSMELLLRDTPLHLQSIGKPRLTKSGDIVVVAQCYPGRDIADA